MSRREPYRSWRGKALVELRNVYESDVCTLRQIATAYRLTTHNLRKMARRHGWQHNRRPGAVESSARRTETIVCRTDRRAISLRTIMLEAVEGRQ